MANALVQCRAGTVEAAVSAAVPLISQATRLPLQNPVPRARPNQARANADVILSTVGTGANYEISTTLGHFLNARRG